MEERKKRPNFFLRFAAMLLSLILVLGAVALVAFRDELNVDALKRWVKYRNAEDITTGERFAHVGDRSSSMALLQDGLVVCSGTSLQGFDSDGAASWEQAVDMENPIVQSSGGNVVVYDVGGTQLYVCSSAGVVYTYTAEKSYTLLGARVNEKGWLTIVTKESGYKGCVTVLDSTYASVLKQNISSAFVTDAILSSDCRTLAVVTAGQDGTSFESRITFYSVKGDNHTEQGGEIVSCSLGTAVALELNWDDSGIWVVGDNAALLVSEDGSLAFRWDYTGRYLKEFSLDGEGYAVLLLGKYKAASIGELVILDSTGQQTASTAVREEVLDLSAAGDYICVLTSDRNRTYTRDLALIGSDLNSEGAWRVFARSDGSSLLLGNADGRISVPNE